MSSILSFLRIVPHEELDHRMSATLDCHGDIEIICNSDELAPNKMARLTFRTVDLPVPPFQIRVKAPSGKLIVERVIRELPTSTPQSPAPVQFAVQQGVYQIRIVQLNGTAEGVASLTVD